MKLAFPDIAAPLALHNIDLMSDESQYSSLITNFCRCFTIRAGGSRPEGSRRRNYWEFWADGLPSRGAVLQTVMGPWSDPEGRDEAIIRAASLVGEAGLPHRLL